MKKSKYIVEGIVGLAEKMGIATVIEGVETQQQVDCLQHLGVDYLQGYYFGKAMNLRVFINEFL